MIKAKCAPYLKRGQPAFRPELLTYSDHDIVSSYGSEYRGIVQYYLLAVNIRVLNRLRWVMLTSMLKTLASKHRSTVTRMAAKHKAKIDTPSGPRTCFEVVVERAGKQPLVARFGGIPLKRQKNAFIDMNRNGIWDRRESVPEAWRRLGLLRPGQGFTREVYVACVTAAANKLQQDGFFSAATARRYGELARQADIEPKAASQ